MKIRKINFKCNKKEHIHLSGFTLLEILLVVVIVSIIVTLATPRFQKTFTTIQLANTTQDIAQLMRFLRMKAVSEKKTYQLKLDLENRKYYIKATGKSNSAVYETSHIIPKDINIAATQEIISFYPDGTMDESAVFLFRNDGDYQRDMGKMIQKDFDVGQIQYLSHTEYIYSIKTQPSLGRVKVTVPE
jgi:prepilin-type N-terminal cleavage/methylation domain-containing protein